MSTNGGNKVTAVVDTTMGERAFALATEFRAQLDPRLPPALIEHLKANLEALGASLPQPVSDTVPTAPPPVSLAEALTTTANLVAGIHESVRVAKPTPTTRKAYGVKSKPIDKEVKGMLAAAATIVARATQDPSEALAFGILPADIAALQAASEELAAADGRARTRGGAALATGKAKQTALARMLDATARIAAAGMLAFAQNATVRVRFEALKASDNA